MSAVKVVLLSRVTFDVFPYLGERVQRLRSSRDRVRYRLQLRNLPRKFTLA